MSFTIKTLTCLDYKSVRDIFSQLFVESEDAKFRIAWRHRTRALSMGVYKNKDLVGFALVEKKHLVFIGIHHDFQSYGLGSKLLRAVLATAFNRCHNIHLTPVDNEIVISWYVKNGFQLSRISESETPGVPYLVYNAHKYSTRSKD